MATVHKLSVITNSCVKPPIDPRSGLVVTEDKRADASLSSTWHGKDADYNDVIRNGTKLGKSINFDTSNSMMETMNVDLADLTDDEFYERLLSLKNEHRKTLELCENLYSEKLRECRSQSPAPAARQVPMAVARVDADYSVSVQPEVSFHEPQRSFMVDNVKDLSMTPSKPPTGRPHKYNGDPERSASLRKSRQAWTRQSAEHGHWRSMSASSSEDEDIIRTRRSRSRSKSPKARVMKQSKENKTNGVSHIEDMWENFSVDEYAPHSRSASMSRISDSAKNENTGDTWQHRITVPKPFKMTVREANKTPKKTRAMQEIEKNIEAKHLEEEEECQKKFKAKPVPAHVYMPLFDEIMEEKEAKRRYIKEHCSEMIASMMKPFKFDTRNASRQKTTQRSRTFEEEDCKPRSTHFKANPFPEHIFDDAITDRVREEEEYRKIRVQMRSEEMLRAASLPNNMKSKGKSYTEGKSRQKMYAEKAKRAGFTRDHKFKPQINKGIPDFEAQHRKFLKEVANAKYQKEATVCKPFTLKTERIAARKHKMYDDISTDDLEMRDGGWRYQDNMPRHALTGSLSTSMDSLPARMTASSHLRTSSNKEKMKRQLEAEVLELEGEKRRRQKEQQLKKSIAERAAANDQSVVLKDHTKIKLREYKDSERMRQQEYRKQMNAMNNRVQDRPLLFERTSQNNAKQAADRKYRDTLRAAGLDEDFVTRKSQTAGHQDDLLDSEEEESFLKSFGSRPMSASTSARTRTPTGSARTQSSRKYTEDFENEQTDEGSDISEEIMDG